MDKELLIYQFELNITNQVLSFLSNDNGIFKQEDLLAQAVYATNKMLKRLDLIDRLWARRRDNRVFLFSPKNNIILAEIAISADKTIGGLKRPSFLVLGRRGYVRARTLQDLANYEKFIKRR